MRYMRKSKCDVTGRAARISIGRHRESARSDDADGEGAEVDSDEPVSKVQITGIRNIRDIYMGVKDTGSLDNEIRDKMWDTGDGIRGQKTGYAGGCRCGVNSACVSALTAGMRCLASRATLPRALEYSHFGRGQVSGVAALWLRCGDAHQWA